MKATCKMLLAILPAVLATAGVLSSAQGSGKPFILYDNMFYKGKPDTAQIGMIASNIIYENKIWPDRQNFGTLPDRAFFQDLVRTSTANPGPLVIDIERISLRTSPEIAQHNADTLAKLADWAHEAAPGKVVGYYGTNTLSDIPAANMPAARELVRHVDAFFPPLYTFDDDRARWEKRAQTSLEQSRELDSEKPVYFYIWPQYHVGSVKAMRYVNGDYWKFELQTARKYGDGIVIWSSSTYPWNPASGWWDATQQFALSLQTVNKAAQPN